MERRRQQVDAHVVFLKPPEIDEDWFQTDLRRQAEAIRGAHVFCDQEGLESERFRARTSGLALLYSDSGVLLFQGGITPARGHEGGNDGIAAVEAILRNDGTRVRQTPVFGCPLQMPDFLASKDSSR